MGLGTGWGTPACQSPAGVEEDVGVERGWQTAFLKLCGHMSSAGPGAGRASLPGLCSEPSPRAALLGLPWATVNKSRDGKALRKTQGSPGTGRLPLTRVLKRAGGS